VSTEQRQFPRYPVEVAAEIHVGKEVAVAATRDISSGGVSLIIDHPLGEGQKINLTLFLTQDGIEDPDEDPFEAQATVMWSAERDGGSFTAGIRFDKVTPAQNAHLGRFLTAIGKPDK
jgi:c-di-GMP-binding flagellar brake protein YcgR